MECGKCSAVCPVTRFEKQVYASPRLLVEEAMVGNTEAVLENSLFWSCLTCKRCSALCPSDVFFSEFIRDARRLARREGRFGPCTHGEVIQTWGRMMTDPALRQNRIGWIPENALVSEDGDTVFFVGCAPHYDALFRHLDTEGIDISRASVKILNHIGIVPQIMADERCCGHDQLWEGDFETFTALARINLKSFAETGARRIITACPECARTLKLDYPRLIGEHGMEVQHLAEVMAEALENGSLKVDPPARSLPATYQDPCRLGRHLGVYQAPRRVMAALGFEVREMEDSKQASLCCGTSCWTACGQVSKAIQVERLKQAKATAAHLLITACIKCQIHFRCAQLDPDVRASIDIDIRDITAVTAGRLAAGDGRTDTKKSDYAASL
jgi:Fe-S oxidoreductase